MRRFLNGLFSPFHDFNIATIVAPAPDTLRLFSGKRAGRVLLRTFGPLGLDTALQPNLFSNKVGRWNPSGNSATPPAVDGIAAPTILGTATVRNVAVTNMATRARRMGYVSAATAAAFAGNYNAGGQYTIGATAGLGGFYYVCRFVSSDAAAVSGARMFVGLRAPAVPTNVEPDTLVNTLGVAALSTSANLQLVSGGSAAQAAIDLGVNFPANGLSTDLYELALFAPPNTQEVYWQVTRLNTGHIASGVLNGVVGVAIPAAATPLGHMAWRCNNAQLLAVGLDVVSLYIETDN